MNRIEKTRFHLGVIYAIALIARAFRYIFIVAGMVFVLISVAMFCYRGADLAAPTLLAGSTILLCVLALRVCEKVLLKRATINPV